MSACVAVSEPAHMSAVRSDLQSLFDEPSHHKWDKCSREERAAIKGETLAVLIRPLSEKVPGENLLEFLAQVKPLPRFRAVQRILDDWARHKTEIRILPGDYNRLALLAAKLDLEFTVRPGLEVQVRNLQRERKNPQDRRRRKKGHKPRTHGWSNGW